MKFLHASMIVAAFMLLGRITGFLREIVIAQIGGASQQSDLMIVFLTFPDMMISLLLGGGLMAALVPAFRSLSNEACFALFLRAIVLLGIIFGFLALLIAVFSNVALGIVAPGWNADLIAQITSLFRFTLIALPITAISGIAVAFLNSKERFTFGAVGTLVFNICLITAMLLFAQLSPVVAIVIGIVSGAALRLIMQVAATLRFWVAPDFEADYQRPRLLRRFAGSFGFFSVLALLPPLARAYASLIEPGALSMFNYAYKLMELPMAIIVTAIVTVLLPRLSGYIRDAEPEHAARILGLALRAAGVLLLGIAIATIFQGETVARIVFFSAPFTSEQFETLGSIVAVGFIGLPFQGLVLLYGTAFVSYDRTDALVLASVVMVVVMAAVGFKLQSMWGVSGLMMGYVIAQICGAFVLTIWLFRISGLEPFRIALKMPIISVVFPAFVCLALSWGFRQTGIGGASALLLSSGAFFIIHIIADPSALRSILNRR